MDINELKEIPEILSRLTISNDKTLKALANLKDSQKKQIRLSTTVGLTRFTISEHHARADTAVALCRAALEDSEKFLAIPITLLQQLISDLNVLITSFDQTTDALNSLKQQGGIASAASWSLSSPNGAAAVNLSMSYESIRVGVDAILDTAYQLTFMISPKKPNWLSEGARLNAMLREEILSGRRSIASRLTEANNKADAIVDQGEKVEALTKSTVQLAEQAVEAHEQIGDDLKKITSLLETLSETRAKADLLSQQVDAAQARFIDFDKKIAERVASIESGNDDLEELTESLKEASTTAVEIISNARQALQLGTAQGLASAFSSQASKLDEPLRAASNIFALSLGLLLEWIVIVFTLFNQALPKFAPVQNDGIGTLLSFAASFGAHALLILPPIWLVIYANDRLRTLTANQEMYSFKQAVSTSLPGFKEQISGDQTDHEKAMTLAAYERLTFNPAEVTPAYQRKQFGFLSRWLIRIVEKAIDDTRSSRSKTDTHSA